MTEVLGGSLLEDQYVFERWNKPIAQEPEDDQGEGKKSRLSENWIYEVSAIEEEAGVLPDGCCHWELRAHFPEYNISREWVDAVRTMTCKVLAVKVVP